MRTIIYVDGFNLYYGCLKNTPYKWLNLDILFSKLLSPENEIIAIKYFTAIVKPSPDNKNSPIKQMSYIRALEKYIPYFKAHYGYFTNYKVKLPRVIRPYDLVEVTREEEKGSDVNLATHLLNDAWLDKYDCAVIVSNDSDMAEAMRLIKEHHEAKILGLITPGEELRTSESLRKHADFTKKIRNSFLKKSQLPNPIPNSTIHKPPEWD